VTIKEKRRSDNLPSDSDVSQGVSTYFGQFWQWKNFADYLVFITSMAALIGVATCIFKENHLYQGFLGLTSSAVEAGLGVPQFLLNYRRQNTDGLT
jgi:hypothetical protein